LALPIITALFYCYTLRLCVSKQWVTALRSLMCSCQALSCTCSPSPHYEVLRPMVKRAAQSTGLVPQVLAVLVTGCTILRAKLAKVFLSIVRSHLPGIGASHHAALRSQLHLVQKGCRVIRMELLRFPRACAHSCTLCAKGCRVAWRVARSRGCSRAILVALAYSSS